MSIYTEKKWKRLVIFIPVLIAVFAVIILVRIRKGPQQHPDAEKPRAVRVMQMQTADVIPRVTGYGYAEPGQVWQAVPQVSGRIVEVHPSFRKGSFIKQGETVVKTDPAEYELNLSQMEASMENIRAQLSELGIKEKNIRVSLEIEKKSLILKEKNIERNQTALSAKSISPAQLDQARLEFQTQSARVQEMENSLNLIPATRKTLQTSLSLNQAKLDQAKLDLKHTAITAPFDCRITETKAEMGQFVQKGQSIASADGTAWAEIAAQLPMEKMARVIRSASGKPLEPGMENMDAIREMFGLKVKVRVQSGSLNAQWDAEFGRADATIDARTRSIGVIAVVDKPYEQILMGRRPPLVRNMFCEVEITGKPISGKMVIPVSALRDGHVFVMNAQKRLERRKVVRDFAQDDFAVLTEGLKDGEWLVVSDLIPAIEGMLLEPAEDKILKEKIMHQASGQREKEAEKETVQ